MAAHAYACKQTGRALLAGWCWRERGSQEGLSVCQSFDRSIDQHQHQQEQQAVSLDPTLQPIHLACWDSRGAAAALEVSSALLDRWE